jgi:hypothetical protein
LLTPRYMRIWLSQILWFFTSPDVSPYISCNSGLKTTPNKAVIH